MIPKSKAAKAIADPAGADGLTDKQRIFIEEYLVCWNASEAARRAGYSPKTAQQMGAENLSKPVIRQAIDRRLSEKRMSADEVLARLSEQAGADMDEFLSKRGRGIGLDLSKAKAAGKLHLVKKYNKTKQGVSIELYDAQAALVQLGRYHKLFTDRVEVITPKEALLKRLNELGLTLEDVRSNARLAEFFQYAGIDVADRIPDDGGTGGEQGSGQPAGAGVSRE